MKPYNRNENCPACGFEAHSAMACFGSLKDTAWCSTPGQHVHRECLICGGTFIRACLTDEKMSGQVVRERRFVVEGKAVEPEAEDTNE